MVRVYPQYPQYPRECKVRKIGLSGGLGLYLKFELGGSLVGAEVVVTSDPATMISRQGNNHFIACMSQEPWLYSKRMECGS